MDGAPDLDYFPRGRSVLRRVHGAKIRGLDLRAARAAPPGHTPVAFAGLMANTEGLDAPFNRLAHTATTMERIFFGSRGKADRELERIRRLHEQGPGHHRPAGRAAPGGLPLLRARSRFLLWILACLADSAQAAYERFLRRLDDEERESFWQDYLLVGSSSGCRATRPTTWDYRAYMQERLAGDELYVTDEAREIGTRVALSPFRRTAPTLRVINFAVLSLLPARVRGASTGSTGGGGRSGPPRRSAPGCGRRLESHPRAFAGGPAPAITISSTAPSCAG